MGLDGWDLIPRVEKRIDSPVNEIKVSVDGVIGKSRLVVGRIGHVFIWVWGGVFGLGGRRAQTGAFLSNC